MTGALDDIRVLDLTRILAGPVATQILGDLGAEILKIEKPYAGDDTRHWGPPFLQDDDKNNTSESAYYLCANRNKKSIAVDITQEEGQKIIHRLLEKSDVLIHNFKVGGLDKYGLSYDQIKDRHPHLIYCAISGFGQTGPMASEPGYDFLAQGMAGLMACTGEIDGEPMKIGVALSDVMSGLYAVIGILAALNARQASGRGQMVDLALTNCTLASLTNIAQYYLTSGKTAPRQGNAHSTIVPYQAFKTADGFLILAIGNDRQFARFCNFVGKDEWADDERFASNQNRVINREELLPHIKALMAQQSCEYWLTNLPKINVPCGPVNTMDQVFDMEQIHEQEMQIEMDHALRDAPIKMVGSPLKLSDTPVAYKNAPPVLGQHTDEILKDILELSSEDIANLARQKITQSR